MVAIALALARVTRSVGSLAVGVLKALPKPWLSPLRTLTTAQMTLQYP